LLNVLRVAFQVLEKAAPSSPHSLVASQRLKKSFERVKAQVDLDLLQFHKDVSASLRDGQQGRDLLDRCTACSS
jgi:hypothetical protein